MPGSGGEGPPLFLTSPLLSEAGVPHLFTTRHFPGVRQWRDPAGPFEPRAIELFGRRGLGRTDGAAGSDGAPIAFLRQVHGADVLAVDKGGLAGRADVVTTGRPGLPLAIFTADCLPIIVYDPSTRRLAMAHAGWRGTVESAARVAADTLAEAGGRRELFLAAIGPSIGPCCYEVGGPVIERLDAAFPGRWQNWATAAAPGKWMLDLWRANEDQLQGAGIPPERIDNPRLCTSCRIDLFFSYRRGRGEGRLVAVAAVPDRRVEAC